MHVKDYSQDPHFKGKPMKIVWVVTNPIVKPHYGAPIQAQAFLTKPGDPSADYVWDRLDEWYVPEARYATRDRWMYDHPAPAALRALEYVRRENERLNVLLDRINAVLPGCPRATTDCTGTDCSPAPGKSCTGPNAPRHSDMGE